MRRHNIAIAGLLTLLFVVAGTARDRYVVRTVPAPSKSIWNLASQYGSTVEKTLKNSGGDHVYVLSVPLESVESLKNDNDVQTAEPDLDVSVPRLTAQTDRVSRPQNAGQYVSFFGTSAWSPYVDQPAASIIRIGESRGYATGAGIVAVIDTGADISHPVLSPALISGWDFTRNIPGGDEGADVNQEVTPILDQEVTPILDSNGTIIFDPEIVWERQEVTPILDSRIPAALGHGTMTAGIIHLVAPTTWIMPLKAFRSDGTGSLSDVIAAIYWAVDHGAGIISMSFDVDVSIEELKKAINYANSRQVILVASAGNYGEPVVVYPAGYNQVIGVASTTNSDARSSFSNYGSAVMLAAPGEAIVSTYPHNRYAMGWGTSFSAPMVAGAAALLLQLDGQINSQKVTQSLNQAAPVFSPGLGAGRLDLVRACVYASTH